MKISVIIPVYNEQNVIGNCLQSLAEQTLAKQMEVIVVDDGSTDTSASATSNFKFPFGLAQGGQISNLVLLKQNHLGPGAARNFGAENAHGDILIFVDADMEFEPDFLEKLIVPIAAKEAIGTFSKEEYLLNKDQPIARYWNLNLERAAERMVSSKYPDQAPVFRAILRSKFIEAGGFDTNIGYTDDWSLSKKLGIKAQAAKGAKFYHRNPDSLPEVWTQARWFGKNEFLTKNLVRQIYNLARYCPLLALLHILDPQFMIFKFVYNSAVFTSVFLSFFGEKKFK